MSKSVLIIGSGGREHAIAWKIAQSPQIAQIYAAPGSYAIEQLEKAQNIPIDIKNFQEIIAFAKKNHISLVIVGPEDPLANGIADALLAENIPVFGPTKHGARIEADKDWSKAFMDANGIPTARWRSFADAASAKDFINKADFPALVVKASGLAAGKGVIVAKSKSEACSAVDEILVDSKFGSAGSIVVIEELLLGEEVSLLAFTDGTTITPMLPAQDHKRIFDNDEGPNTGGMGAYAPCPLLVDIETVTKSVLEPAIAGFRKLNIKYVGVLYAGLMLTENGVKVLEFNARFGDPETEVLLPLLETDLYEVMAACASGSLGKLTLKWKDGLSAVGVVMASKGYPETSSKGQEITGAEPLRSDSSNPLVFHCGTALHNSKIVTNGGRVLIAVALAPQLAVAAARATKTCSETIHFAGAQYRRDIAEKGIAASILHSGALTYKSSGVDIVAGNDLVEHIKPAARSTHRSGVLGSLGGFGGLFDTKAAGYVDPLLVSGTDGVGTKLKIAQEMDVHDTIGIDLVAMCVNDVLAHGAEPLFFLDYFACGRLDVGVAKGVVAGVAEGCRRARCALVGGETAEMPDVYAAGEYDVAGFAVGAVERGMLMPRVEAIEVGDVVVGLPSSGVHSNGFSLVRRVMKVAGVGYRDRAVFSENGRSFGEELLTPTMIYVEGVIPAVKTGRVKAFAHITGGGLTENVPRVLPKHLGVELDAEKWAIPGVFPWLATVGGVNKSEMLQTFNCGIGGILIVKKTHEDQILDLVKCHNGRTIGEIVPNSGEQVIVNNFTKVMQSQMRPHVPSIIHKIASKKRVGVLISGSGTNLQALIDATQTAHIGAEIVLVISNKANVEGLKRAKLAGIPTKTIQHADFPARIDFDRVLHENLVAAGVEIVCLAGFMRILSGEFTAKWAGRLINVHPALLPLFKGVRAQQQALEAGVRVSGCTVHFVDETVDGGHIIAQETVPVHVGDTEADLVERIKAAEHRAFPRALEWVANGKVALDANRKLVWRM